ncbi:fucose-specific lectin [Pluteus cervinus]|uniref:Fucose-specific lectin n=1 Tax=Pluteus cervinus TaxID=181527 RepID=A0ACD3A4N1_9AGAR|nr:fucose-specific lectin [Pluteus cervinus]
MDGQTPFEDLYPKELRTQPLPPPPVSIPFWKTRRGVRVVGITILAFAIIGAIVGIVVSTEKKSEGSDAKSSGAGGTSSNGTVAGLGGAGVAAVNWQDNGQQIRVYIQKDDGFVYEAASEQSNNWNTNTTTQLFQAKAGTPLAAVVPGPSQIHLYYLDTSNILQEYIYDGSWAKGPTLLPYTNLAPNTSLAATTWTDSSSVQQIRLYYQKQDNTIQELSYATSSGWSPGHSFTDQAYPGTGLSAVANSAGGNLSCSIYWQGNDLTLNQYILPPSSWTRNTLQWSPAPSSGIAAIIYADYYLHDLHVRVYHESTAGIIQEDAYDAPPSGAQGWSSATTAINSNTLVNVPTPISTTVWTNSTGIEVRSYVKNSTNNVYFEFSYSIIGGDSSGWNSKELSF